MLSVTFTKAIFERKHKRKIRSKNLSNMKIQYCNPTTLLEFENQFHEKIYRNNFHKKKLTSVSLTPCTIASSPRLAYNVTNGNVCLKHPKAQTNQSALVSAKIQIRSIGFKPIIIQMF